jgi:hypothetical protein
MKQLPSKYVLGRLQSNGMLYTTTGCYSVINRELMKVGVWYYVSIVKQGYVYYIQRAIKQG